jgi:hypothetical protein
MHEELSHVSDAGVKRAARYFSSPRFTRWTRVIEPASVPKTHMEYYGLAPTQGAGVTAHAVSAYS